MTGTPSIVGKNIHPGTARCAIDDRYLFSKRSCLARIILRELQRPLDARSGRGATVRLRQRVADYLDAMSSCQRVVSVRLVLTRHRLSHQRGLFWDDPRLLQYSAPNARAGQAGQSNASAWDRFSKAVCRLSSRSRVKDHRSIARFHCASGEILRARAAWPAASERRHAVARTRATRARCTHRNKDPRGIGNGRKPAVDRAASLARSERGELPHGASVEAA